jgi:SAM-dependent methyltransferase
MHRMTQYDQDFFDSHRQLSLESARRVMPRLLELSGAKSVIDVGCGTGAWLSVLAEQGVAITGIDGEYAIASGLLIPRDRFVPHDLKAPIPQSLGRFDLAMCLEVGEHLEKSRAASLVSELCSLAPMVAFSAAIPRQGGLDHINECWQSEWARLFEGQGFTAIDAVRPAIWTDTRVAMWYRQNLIVYVRAGETWRYPNLAPFLGGPYKPVLDVVHPEMFSCHLGYFAPENVGIRRAFGDLRSAIGRAWTKRRRS